MTKKEIQKWFMAGVIYRCALQTGAWNIADQYQREYLEATK